MKRIYYIIALITTIAFTSCSSGDDVASITPSNISNVRSEAQPGKIKLSWDLPADKNLEYVKITYFDHLAKKDMMRLASVYSDSIVIPNTRQKFGDYNFTLQPFSSTDTPGDALQFAAKSGPAPTTVTVIDVKPLKLNAEDLFTDAQEPSEGPIKDLIDGNTGTYFHAAWSVDKGPMPHYIVAKLPKSIHGLRFSYTTRNHSGSGNHPKVMNVYVSNDFDGSTYDVSGLTHVDEFTSLPNGAAQSFNSQDFVLDNEYQYVWFEINETHGGTNFFAMSELSVSEVILQVVDPEAPAEGD